jgi:hypothetical protein
MGKNSESLQAALIPSSLEVTQIVPDRLGEFWVFATRRHTVLASGISQQKLGSMA